MCDRIGPLGFLSMAVACVAAAANAPLWFMAISAVFAFIIVPIWENARNHEHDG